MSTSEIATVLAWHDALSAADVDTLVSLSSDDIEIGDAHGAAQGHAALRDWAEKRSWATQADEVLEVGSIYYREGVVVVEELVFPHQDPAQAGDDDVAADEAPRVPIRTAASASRVVDDRVTAVFRHEDLAAALAATEMTDDDLQS